MVPLLTQNSSVQYRTIKLFIVGRGGRGKTTLLRRLRGLPDERVESTTGIDIEDWTYPEPKKFSFKAQKKPVHFLAWDFAGQVGSDCMGARCFEWVL